jgi:hypothetical protein
MFRGIYITTSPVTNTISTTFVSVGADDVSGREREHGSLHTSRNILEKHLFTPSAPRTILRPDNEDLCLGSFDKVSRKSTTL